MIIVPLDTAGLASYKKRFSKVAENSSRQFGSMNAGQMVNHVRLLVEVSLEERRLPNFSNWLARRSLFHWMIIEVLPWPKGKIKAPILLNDETLKTFEEEQLLLEGAMERFAAAVSAQPLRVTLSPMLGPITLTKWSRIHGRHFEHHLQQFGV